MEELKFDHETHAAKGLYVPPLGNAVDNTDWQYIGGNLREKQGHLWLEEIPEAAFMSGKIITVAHKLDVKGVAFVRRVEGTEAKPYFKAGDCVMMSGHALSSGMRLPSSVDVPALAANIPIRIIDAALAEYRILQERCRDHYEAGLADKKALANTQAEIAAKSKPEEE
jgi:hypothetical protein